MSCYCRMERRGYSTSAWRKFATRLSAKPASLSEPSRTCRPRSEEHTSELQSPCNLVCRLLLEKKKKNDHRDIVNESERFFQHIENEYNYVHLDHKVCHIRAADDIGEEIECNHPSAVHIGEPVD